MRRRIRYRPYALLAGYLFLLLSLPNAATEKMRYAAVGFVTPVWKSFNFLKNAALQFLTIVPPLGKGESSELLAEVETLKRENLALRTQLVNVRQWLLQEERIDDELQRWKAIHAGDVPADLKEFTKRRAVELRELLDLQLRALPAKVIFREPTSWSSFVWLDVGERHNRFLKKRIVAKNSPVVVGTSLVGVVEEVGEKKCKVRLITDAGLTPSVRAIRGKEQNRFLLEHLEGLILGLGARLDLFTSTDDAKLSIAWLGKLKERLKGPAEDHFLAKGALHGTSQSLLRSRGTLLVGEGFNYDFADEEGEARDLRTGDGVSTKRSNLSILKAGDLLVTTGMDGVFPEGLRVAIVTQVVPLREGACSYEIEAKATSGSLDYLSHLTVLPPCDY